MAMAYTLIKEYANKMKSIDWTDDLIRRNPLYYGKLERLFRWLGRVSLDERKAWTNARVQAICAKAAKTKYGRELGGPLDVSSWPLICNADVRNDPFHFMKSPALFAAPANTSGTTGMPLKLFRSHQSVVVEQMCIDALLLQNGCDLRKDKMASLKGDNIKPPSELEPPFWKYSMGGRRMQLSSNHLSLDTCEHYYDVLRHYKPDCLMAYPTSVESLSDCLLQTGRRLSVPLVVASSEVLTERARELARQALGCKVIEYYGQSERVAFAYSVRANEFYFVPGYAYVELQYIVSEGDADLYEIVGTSLWNTAMPLVRYRTGDLIRVPAGTTEAQLERIRYGLDPFPEIVGRTDDWYLDSPEGVRLMGIPHIARDTENVRQLQIVQETLEYVRFLVIPTGQYNEKDEQTIRHNASLKLPDSMRISIEKVDRPIRTQQGKTPYVLRRWEMKE